MKNLRKTCAFCMIAAMLSTGAVFADGQHDDHRNDPHNNSRNDPRNDPRNDHHDNHSYVRHNEWKKGYHMQHGDWNRGERVDYRTYHLRRPPNGYEWRLVDGNYVMAAVATGVIASIIMASQSH